MRTNKLLAAAIFLLLLESVFRIGLRLRESDHRHGVVINTVFSYYFDKTQRLHQDGRLPSKDTWRLAPGVGPENVPPFLAYSTVWAYKIFSFSHPGSFRSFVNFFPILVYGLWLLSLLVLFARLFTPWIALAAAAVFSVLPVSVELTRRGSYFQELPGNWLLFVTACLLPMSASEGAGRWAWTGAAVLTVTALNLSWQQFPVLYGAAGLILLSSVRSPLFGPATLRWCVALGLPLLLGELLSRFAAGIEYSPVSMLGEAALGLWRRADPVMAVAMRRGDWRDVALLDLYAYFGWLGLALTGLGTLRAWARWDDLRYRSFGVFGLVGIALLALFIKERFLAMSLCLPLMAMGLESLFSPRDVLTDLQARGRTLMHACRRFQDLLASRPRARKVLLCAVAAAALGVVFRLALPSALPQPVLRLSLEPATAVGKESAVVLVMENRGGPPPRERFAFAGMHVEVENAEVHGVRAESGGREDRVTFKNFAQAGNTFFFESKHGWLGPGQHARVSFRITPYGRPVRIFYRGWIPGPCSDAQRREALQDLLAGWRNLSRAGWRNEACIRRAPAAADESAPICRVPVFAAHKTLQDFPCFVSTRP